jgi:hypothetical protein
MRTLQDMVAEVREAMEAQDAADLMTEEDVLDLVDGPDLSEAELDADTEMGATRPNQGLMGGGDQAEEGQTLDPMDESELLGIISKEMEGTVGGDEEGELTGELVEAMRYYFGHLPVQPKKGRSKVVSTDLADMLEALLAEIVPTFAQDLSVEFESEGEEDENTAQEESAVCSKIVQQDNQGFVLWYELIKSALLQKNCVAKVYVEEETTFTRETLEVSNEMTLAQALTPRREGETVEVEEAEQLHTMPGAPGALANVVLRRTLSRKRVKIEAVPLAELRIKGDHKSINLKDCGFICHEREVPASDLIADGYDPDLVDQIPTASGEQSELSSVTSQVSAETDSDESSHATRPVRVREVHIRVDYDGDGLAELRKVVIGGEDIILENEEESAHNFGSGTAFIMPGRWVGLSLHDKLKQIQDSKTKLLRQAIDNGETANNNRLGYVIGQVRTEDLFNSKPGGGVAMKRADSLVPIPHTDVIPSIFAMLGYQDKMRTERGGSALDTDAEALPVGGNTAHGAERMMTKQEAMSALITETLGQTVVRDVYLLVHRVLREQIQGQLQYKRANGWQTANPAQWPVREGVTVKAGKSHGERMRQQGALIQILGQQTQALQQFGPGVLVDAAKFHNTLTDYARMAGLGNVEQYWIDPDSPDSQQAAQANAQQAKEQQDKLDQQQSQMMQMQQAIIQMQEETKRMKATMDQQLGYAKLREDQRQHTEDVATRITELELDSARDVTKQQKDNRPEAR